MACLYTDIECDSLKPTQMWCVSLQSDKWSEPKLYQKSVIYNAVLKANEGQEIYAHNGMGFDFPVLERLWGIDLSKFTLRDTLVLSRLVDPERPEHNLESWGEQLGFPKGDFHDFSKYTTEMGDYCKRDTSLLKRIKEELDKLLVGFGEESIKLEHEVAPIISGQIDNGWLLDTRKCHLLLAELKEKKLELEDKVREVFVPLPVFEKVVTPKEKKDGTMSVVGLKFLGDLWTTVCGPFSRIDYPVFNLGSRQQIARHLQYYGWKPTKFTDPSKNYPQGQVQIDEDILEGVEIPQAQLIAEYMMVQKRIAMANSWINAADDEDRVHGFVNPNGAVTGRMTHSGPNMGQVVADGKAYGLEMRSCWIARPGYKIVGVDADALELVMLAHYLNDENFTKAVSEGSEDEGTDIHTVNKHVIGVEHRGQAKTIIYAIIYGQGDKKTGASVGGGAGDGKRVKAKLGKSYPSLPTLIERVHNAARRGFLKGLDGRKIRVRKVYSSLNTLLQGAGAVIMKRALVILYNTAKEAGLDFYLVGNIHDEIQAEVKEEHAPAFANLAEQAIRKAGEYYSLRCPVKGGASIGDSWAETH